MADVDGELADLHRRDVGASQVRPSKAVSLSQHAGSSWLPTIMM
jgi:hypothetical protein